MVEQHRSQRQDIRWRVIRLSALGAQWGNSHYIVRYCVILSLVHLYCLLIHTLLQELRESLGRQHNTAAGRISWPEYPQYRRNSNELFVCQKSTPMLCCFGSCFNGLASFLLSLCPLLFSVFIEKAFAIVRQGLHLTCKKKVGWGTRQATVCRQKPSQTSNGGGKQCLAHLPDL